MSFFHVPSIINNSDTFLTYFYRLKVENNNNNNERENEEDDEEVYLKDCQDEITSNVSHLLELSKTINSNSQIKPFLLCIQKMFAILLRKLKEQPAARKLKQEQQFNNSDNNSDQSARGGLLASQSIIDVDTSFDVHLTATAVVDDEDENDQETSSSRIRLDWLHHRLGRLNFHILDSSSSSSIWFETAENRAETREYFGEFFERSDWQNTNKTMVFLVDCLADSVLRTHDELNCVEIVEIVNELILKLIDSSQFGLAAYLLLETVGKRIEREIDLIEAARVRNELRACTNERLTSNLFFLAELYSRRVGRLVEIVERLATTVNLRDDRELAVLGSVLARLFFLITKIVIRKITRFDALVDVDFNLDCLFKTCLKIRIVKVILLFLRIIFC